MVSRLNICRVQQSNAKCCSTCLSPERFRVRHERQVKDIFPIKAVEGALGKDNKVTARGKSLFLDFHVVLQAPPSPL